MKAVKQQNIPKEQVRQAVAVLHQGGIVAYPTETYYGLGVDPCNIVALRKLFEIKKREQNKPILLLIAELEQLEPLVAAVPKQYEKLIETYWPGPLTLIFPARDDLPHLVSGGTGTVGIRLTPHPVARNLIQQTGYALTSTSANVAGGKPAQTAGEVYEIFTDKVDCILDGGKTEGGLSSTVVGLRRKRLHIYRPGKIVLPGVDNGAAG